MDLNGGELGSVCVAVIAAQRGLERCVEPLKLWCRWNAPLPRDDGGDHGDTSLLDARCFVLNAKFGRKNSIANVCCSCK